METKTPEGRVFQHGHVFHDVTWKLSLLEAQDCRQPHERHVCVGVLDPKWSKNATGILDLSDLSDLNRLKCRNSRVKSNLNGIESRHLESSADQLLSHLSPQRSIVHGSEFSKVGEHHSTLLQFHLGL